MSDHTHVVPTQAVPTQAVPTQAVPTRALLTQAVPTQAVPTRALHARARRLAPPALAALGAGAAAAVASVMVRPSFPAHVPCPTHSIFGIYCPFCGGTRALAALWNGDIVAALRDNLVVGLAIPAAAALWVWWVVGAARGYERRLTLPRYWGPAIVAALALYTVVRNVAAMRGVLTP